MSRLTTRIPKYRLHKASGRAVVTLNGRDVYLGAYGTPESKAEYNRRVAEWQLNGQSESSRSKSVGVVIDEVIRAYMAHVERYYRKNGQPTSTQQHIRDVLRPLHRLYGESDVTEFGPLALKAVREQLIAHGWSRPTINKAAGIIKRMFKWAAENELVSAEIYHRLQTVSGLRKGRSEAPEPEPVEPAPEGQVDAVLKIVSTPVASMIRLQCYTGMRPAEVVTMRLCEIDQSEKIWVYTPVSHKTEHHGRKRRIYIGPKAQRILMPYMRTDPQAYLFSPNAAESERRRKQHAKRKTPLSCGNRPGSNRKPQPKRSPGERYTVDTYRRAITRACEQAFPPPDELAKKQVPAKKGVRWETDSEWRQRLGEEKWDELKAWRKAHHWSPNQLRHNAATYLSAVMDPTVSLLEIHKLMYLMQESGQDLKLKFEKGLYGPYGKNLRHVLTHIEGHFITGYGDAADDPTTPIEPKPEAIAIADAFLDDHPQVHGQFDRVVRLIDGYETPFGMELLSTVHWVGQYEGAKTADEAAEKTYAWGDRKRMFRREHIDVAWEALCRQGWLGKARKFSA